MIVVTNRIPVAPGWGAEFEARFSRRAHLVDGHAGFVRHEVHRPTPMRFDRETGWEALPADGGVYEVKTWWARIEDFQAWTRSESFAAAHRDRPPPEMFSGKPELVIHALCAAPTG